MCEFEIPENAILYADSARGIYIPQHFAESVVRSCVCGVDAEQWHILESGPDHEFYFDVWCEVIDSARITDPKSGVAYSIWQDGDMWLIPMENGV
jgi:hypothetical protein